MINFTKKCLKLYIFKEFKPMLKAGHHINQLYKLNNNMLFTQSIKFLVHINCHFSYSKALLWNLFGVHACVVLSGSCM